MASTIRFVQVEDYQQWRDEARRLIGAEVPPDAIQWSADPNQPTLFETQPGEAGSPTAFSVPKRFLEMARVVACHRDQRRWSLLYRVLWRLTHGETDLLNFTVDDDVHRLMEMQKAVARDMHKMKAFVRFRKLVSDDEEHFVAWHRPDHCILELVAPFFARRFKAMNWSILTPDESVRWDQQQLHYGAGVPASEAPQEDALEDLWRTYYASIFNPARIKLAMMKQEMPVRHWPTLPETEIIAELIRDAPGRIASMIGATEGFQQTAAHFMPGERTISTLAAAAARCRACDLHGDATQTVFGRGPTNAMIVLVGEQPGDQEDMDGEPFVGPAGHLLDQALRQAGISRDEVYITNVVKHFKHMTRGKRRLHQKPNSREIFACRPWLEAELEIIRPQGLVCLGATAAQALIGRDFRITKCRGELLTTEWCERTVATWHPAAILRMPASSRREQMKVALAADLANARLPASQ